jgi:hypothetical protein
VSAKFEISGGAGSAIKAVEDLSKAIDSAAKKSDGLATNTRKAEEMAKRLAAQADPTLRYSQQLEKLATAVHKGGLELGHAETLAVKYRTALDKTSESGDRAFGAAAVSKLMAFTGGLSGIAAMFRAIEQDSQRAADSVFNALAQAGELQQLGPEQFGKSAAVARQLVRSGAVSPENKGQAFDIATNLANSGYSDEDIQYLVGLASDRLVSAQNLEPLGGAAAKFGAAYNGEPGTLPQMMDKVLVAAGATQADAVQTINEVLKFAGLANSAGVGDEQSLAAYVAAEKRSPTPEAAAEKLKSFFSQVNARQLQNGDLYGTLDNIEAKVKEAGGNAYKVLGDANAVMGYQDLIQSRDLIREQEDAINGAAGAVDSRRGVMNQDPVLGSANARAREEGKYAADTEDLESTRENLVAAVTAANQRRDLRQGHGVIRRAFNFAADAVADAMGGDDWLLWGAQRVEKQNPGTYDPETMKQIERYLAKIAENTSSTDKKVGAKTTTRPE